MGPLLGDVSSTGRARKCCQTRAWRERTSTAACYGTNSGRAKGGTDPHVAHAGDGATTMLGRQTTPFAEKARRCYHTDAARVTTGKLSNMDAAVLKRIGKSTANEKRRAYQAQLKQIYDSTKGGVIAEIGALEPTDGQSFKEGCRFLIRWYQEIVWDQAPSFT